MGELDGRVAVIPAAPAGPGEVSPSLPRRGPRSCCRTLGSQGTASAGREEGGAALRSTREAMVCEDGEHLIDDAISAFGKVDMMVNNAGGAENNAPVAELTDEAFDLALRWNVWSTFWCTRRALNDMIPRKWARIINISSLEGKAASRSSPPT